MSSAWFPHDRVWERVLDYVALSLVKQVSGFDVVTCEACESGFDRGCVTCVTGETSESSLGCALVT